MKLFLVVVLAACLSIFVAPASSTSLLASAAAVKGAVVGAGLSVLKSVGSRETVVIQSKPEYVAEVVQPNEIIVQDLSLKPAQTITYASSNPISRLWGAVSDMISAKAKAFGNLFSPNRVVVVVPQTTTEKCTTEKTTTEKTNVITIEMDKRFILPKIELAASLGRDFIYRRVKPVEIIKYLKK